jgi:hypothetical protein
MAPEEPKEPADDLIKRIDDAPRTSREDLLRAVLGEDKVSKQTVLNGLLYGTAPPAAEWIDLADAGPYVDETKMPLYTPNGDGSGGAKSFGNAATTQWMDDAFARIREKLSSGSSSSSPPPLGDAHENAPPDRRGDTEMER